MPKKINFIEKHFTISFSISIITLADRRRYTCCDTIDPNRCREIDDALERNNGSATSTLSHSVTLRGRWDVRKGYHVFCPEFVTQHEKLVSALLYDFVGRLFIVRYLEDKGTAGHLHLMQISLGSARCRLRSARSLQRSGPVQVVPSGIEMFVSGLTAPPTRPDHRESIVNVHGFFSTLRANFCHTRVARHLIIKFHIFAPILAL